MKKLIYFALAAVALVALNIDRTNADVTFSNYAPGGEYDHVVNWGITGPDFLNAPGFSAANQFTAETSGALESVKVSLGHFSGGTDWVAALHLDDGADDVGAVIASWQFSFKTPPLGGASIVLNYAGAPVAVVNGMKYWMSVSADWDKAPDLNGGWYVNSTRDGEFYFRGLNKFSNDHGQTWILRNGLRGAFEVRVVPEPTSFSIIVLAT